MEEKKYDLIIIGAGPAGLSAAIYSQRQGLSTIVFGDTPGGNLYMIESVKNYPGFHEGVPGMQLGVFMYAQAQSEGASFTMTNVESLEKIADRFIAKDADGNVYSAPAALIAAGSTPKRLDVQNAASGRHPLLCHVRRPALPWQERRHHRCWRRRTRWASVRFSVQDRQAGNSC